MVEVFKSYALELAKIEAKHKEKCAALEAKIKAKELDMPTIALGQANPEDYEKLHGKFAEWVPAKSKQDAEKAAAKIALAELEENHKLIMQGYFQASQALRKAVAKEWASIVFGSVEKQLLSVWLKEGDGYVPLKRTNLQKEGMCITSSKMGNNLGPFALNIRFEEDSEVYGMWLTVPVMTGHTVDVQMAIIRAMTPFGAWNH